MTSTEPLRSRILQRITELEGQIAAYRVVLADIEGGAAIPPKQAQRTIPYEGSSESSGGSRGGRRASLNAGRTWAAEIAEVLRRASGPLRLTQIVGGLKAAGMDFGDMVPARIVSAKLSRLKTRGTVKNENGAWALAPEGKGAVK